MKRLITYLYNKYCRVQLDTLYLNGIQRDFTKELSPQQEKKRAIACIEFIGSGACEWIFNEILKDHAVSLFSSGYIEEERNGIHGDINVVLEVENKIRNYAHLDKPKDQEDQFNPL